MNLGKVLKAVGIAGTVLSGFTAVMEIVFPHGDELEERVEALEKLVKERSK